MKYENLKRHSKSFSEYTELRVQENTSALVFAVNGDFVGNQKSTSAGLSARAYKDGVWGFASTSEQNDTAIEDTIKRATENANFLASRAEQKDKGLPEGFSGTGEHGKKDLSKYASQKEMIEFVSDIENYLKSKYPEINSRKIRMSTIDTERTIITSDNCDCYSFVSSGNLMLSLGMNAEDSPVQIYDTFGGLGQIKDLFHSPKDLYENIDILVEVLKKKAEGVYAKAGVHDVVLDSELAGILSHEAIGHTVEADLVLGGSVASNFMNRQVASPLVTLVDFAYEYNGKLCPVPIWIDDEGVAAKDAVIIKDGVLQTYMHNKASAKHFGVEPTGNARANDFFDEPLIRMRNTAILPGTSKLEDMISGIEDGYYLIRPNNGQADTTSEFMFGVVLGYEIKNGKLGKALRDCTVAGVAFDMLKTITMISDDMTWSNSGWCGKKQTIKVGMGGPAIKCKIGIGGRA
ncbi:MAG: peptidase [Treponema sp.]|nr:MAG: peptidase [Treponema sp.]